MNSAPVFVHQRTNMIHRNNICARLSRAGYERPHLLIRGSKTFEVALPATVVIVDINDYRKWWAT